MTPEERDLLLDSLLDGSIDEADLLRIEAELTIDPETRRRYYQRVQLDMLLQQASVSDPLANLQANADLTVDQNADRLTKKKEPSDHLPRISIRSAMLAGVFIGLATSLLLLFVTRAWNVDSNGIDQTVDSKGAEPSASGFAILKGRSNAIWSNHQIKVGDLIPAGELHLQSGQAQLELFSGVQLVVQGEARFSIDSAMQVTMQSGLARAKVPEPAKGFVVKTAAGDIIDLGTEFAMHVDSSGADVRVLDGEVHLKPRAEISQGQRLLEGDSFRMSGSGQIIQPSDSNLNLMSSNDFQALLDTQQQSRITEWQIAKTPIRTDSRLLAYYQFSAEDLRAREVQNLASSSNRLASDGAIVAAKNAVDRWGRSNEALDFSPIGSRVRVEVPDGHRGLTLTCWVKINSLDRWYNSLFLTDGHEAGEPHWQIMDDGRIFFSVKLPTIDGKQVTQKEFYSPSIWNPSLIGRWMMLSVTYDVENKCVTHYLNGDAISSEAIPDNALIDSIRIGSASICNWSDPMYRTDAKFVVRNLNGSMDEFAIFSGALSAEEISNFYRVGNPNDF